MVIVDDICCSFWSLSNSTSLWTRSFLWLTWKCCPLVFDSPTHALLLFSSRNRPRLCYYMMSFLFIGHKSEIFEVTPEDLPLSVSTYPFTSSDGTLTINPMIELQQVAPEMKPSPLIVICNVWQTRRACGSSAKGSDEALRVWSKQQWFWLRIAESLIAYNDYGKPVDAEKLKRPVNSADLMVTETLRLILRDYHNKVNL